MFEYAPTMYHLKTMVVDGIFSTVGSANFDDRSFHLNEEINVVVYDAAFAAQMRERYLADLAKCNEYTLAMMKGQSLGEKLGVVGEVHQAAGRVCKQQGRQRLRQPSWRAHACATRVRCSIRATTRRSASRTGPACCSVHARWPRETTC